MMANRQLTFLLSGCCNLVRLLVCTSPCLPLSMALCALLSPACWAQNSVVARKPTTKSSNDNWPCFRGPGGTGVSPAKGLPQDWSDSKNVIWRTGLPGAGASSPITFGDHVYVTCFSAHAVNAEQNFREDVTRHLVCLERVTGRILWDAKHDTKAVDLKYESYITGHGYASSTPAADESGVYVYYGAAGVLAYQHDGKLKWHKSFEWRGKRCNTFNWGTGSSPILFGDLLIINADPESGDVVALDKATNREVWQVPTTAESRSTPLLMQMQDRHELVIHVNGGVRLKPGEGKLAGIEPRTGKQLWECQALDNYLNPNPVAGNGVIFALGGYPGNAVAIRAGGQGDVTNSHLVWEAKRGSAVCTPVFHEDHLYWTNDASGIAYCVNAKTGAIVYENRLEPRPDRIYASGIVADARLYYVSRERGTYVLAAAPRYELLAHNTFASDASVFNATPAVSRGQLLLRSDKYLYCIGKK